MKIKIKLFDEACTPHIIKKGDWIDLKSADYVELEAPKIVDNTIVFDQRLISLGVAMQLPKGYEAIINARSSTFKKFGIMLFNGQGVIDNSYNGDSDVWNCTALALAESVIHKGDRICQFRIQLSQKATAWQKLKWLFSSKIKFEYVDKLGNKDRKGFGSTGYK